MHSRSHKKCQHNKLFLCWISCYHLSTVQIMLFLNEHNLVADNCLMTEIKYQKTWKVKWRFSDCYQGDIKSTKYEEDYAAVNDDKKYLKLSLCAVLIYERRVIDAQIKRVKRPNTVCKWRAWVFHFDQYLVE